MTHLLNHALGLVAVSTAEAGRTLFVALWRNPLGTAVLYTALLVHPALGIAALYRRRTLRMPRAEAWQLVFGLAIPILLAGHVVGTRVAHELYGRADSYTWQTYALWTLRPGLGLKNTTLLLLAWAHACIGLHYWLRLRAWYRRWVPLAYALALLLPLVALGGFAQMGREVTRWSAPADVDRRASALAAARLQESQVSSLATIEWTIYGAFAVALGGVLLARGVRSVAARRRAIRIAYPGGQTVVVPPGFTILEASRLGDVPHVSVCGGKGRCSTCRVRIEAGASALPPPGDDEVRVLRRVGAPPGVRLACQTRPRGDVRVAPLIAPARGHGDALALPEAETGREQDVAVLFADLRGFTSVAERKLPYDVVYLLNRYFEAVGGAVRGAGGIANQFTGDGVMALFGVGGTPEAGCRAALRGAAAMVAALETLSQGLTDELPAPLRLGVGIHVGPAVVGRMGFAEAAYLTAVGDTVHVAARLEELTKTYACELVISEAVAAHAGVDVSAYPRDELTLRNRSTPLAIRIVDDARRLAESPALR
ncbi:MAG: adenylate/guanylate cyclase domain-containing protein [Candidatus Rokubacteria bacterium]|nr:adenylate/guanylate cyclase domain-containing protein [Candidatus Rokubacteria bacterium]